MSRVVPCQTKCPLPLHAQSAKVRHVTSPDEEDGTLADAIVALRGRRRLSQEQLAAQVGVSDRTVKRWESGKAFPRKDARGELIRLGVDPRLFLRPEVRAEVESRLRAVEGEIARIRRFLERHAPA